MDEETKQAIAAIGRDVGAIRSDLAAVRSDLVSLDVAADAASCGMDALQYTIEDIRGEIEAGFEDTNGRLDALPRRGDDGTDAVSLRARADRLETRIEKLERKIR